MIFLKGKNRREVERSYFNHHVVEPLLTNSVSFIRNFSLLLEEGIAFILVLNPTLSNVKVLI
jgi:hypothetical protein